MFSAYRGAGVFKIAILKTRFFGVLSSKKIAERGSPIAPWAVKMACKKNLQVSDILAVTFSAAGGRRAEFFLFLIFVFVFLFSLVLNLFFDFFLFFK